ncbi:ABC transporter permease [Azospirillum brasilense]|uniref:ABC transporter permease n=1 Tax=Azospirillum brasilense TaxID=192 RepID=A0A0P0FAC4_AZOBR|nr:MULTISPECIES: ABC transporter permease [Azospirillum]ALJ37924.1 ABC transporter permease [Azospirillum brasilense]MDW7556627.1 ABC transporter permease [Azospirillum brasilense]MDW7596395.1 ABC transporter permease [Azospirillum brasilense]MDW7631285.1 ABC transporter permease [Azospirillum brasilense]MDX5951861.1 ABC transporter permease [Azospirillum brasilense]
MVRIASALLLVLLLAGWEVYCRVAGVSALVVPLPSAVLRTLWDGLAGGYLLPHIWVTTAEMAMGLAAGCTIGFLAGVLLAEVPMLRRLFYPYILASQVVPKLALGPLFIVWFGFGMTSTVVITALICFFPLLENTMTGLQQVDPNKRELFRMLRATRLQTLLRLKIPSGLPVILAGLRVAVVLALVGAVVGEFIGGRQGLGASIIAAQGMMDSTMMFALFIVITVLGMIVYQAAAGLERWLLRRPWKG